MKTPLNGSILPMSTLIPEPYRSRLVAASKVESRVDFGESAIRAELVDKAAAEARRHVPHLYAQ